MQKNVNKLQIRWFSGLQKGKKARQLKITPKELCREPKKNQSK